MPSSYALGTHFEALMERLIESGRYQSKSEILREGLRMVEDREARRQVKLEALREMIREGEQSGPGIPAEEVFSELRAELEALAGADSDA